MRHASQFVEDALNLIADRVSIVLSPNDHMLPKDGNIDRYLTVGRSAVRNVLLATAAANLETVKNVLDFACGAGRVARWLRAAYPDASLTTSDINQSWVEFCASTFGAIEHKSSISLSDVHFENRFDLIWCGSLLTHLSEEDALTALELMHGALAPSGVMVFTVHGRKMLFNGLSGRADYVSKQGLNEIIMGATFKGFGFARHSPKGIGGISLTTAPWITHWCGMKANRKLVYYTESAWDDHQDVVGVAKSVVHPSFASTVSGAFIDTPTT